LIARRPAQLTPHPLPELGGPLIAAPLGPDPSPLGLGLLFRLDEGGAIGLFQILNMPLESLNQKVLALMIFNASVAQLIGKPVISQDNDFIPAAAPQQHV